MSFKYSKAKVLFFFLQCTSFAKILQHSFVTCSSAKLTFCQFAYFSCKTLVFAFEKVFVLKYAILAFWEMLIVLINSGMQNRCLVKPLNSTLGNPSQNRPAPDFGYSVSSKISVGQQSERCRTAVVADTDSSLCTGRTAVRRLSDCSLSFDRTALISRPHACIHF